MSTISPPTFSASIAEVPTDFETSRALVVDHLLPFVQALPRTEVRRSQVIEGLQSHLGADPSIELNFWVDKILAPLSVGTTPLDFSSDNFRSYHLYFRYVFHSRSIDFMDDPEVKIEFWTLTGTWRKSRRSSTTRPGGERPGKERKPVEKPGDKSGGEESEQEEEEAPGVVDDDEELDYGADEENDQEEEPESHPRVSRRGTSIEIIDQLIPPKVSRPPALPPVSGAIRSLPPVHTSLARPSTSRDKSSKHPMPAAFAPGGAFAPPKKVVPVAVPLEDGASGWYTDDGSTSKGKATHRSARSPSGHPFPSTSEPVVLPPPTTPFRKQLQAVSTVPQISREEFWNQLGLSEAPRNATIAESAEMQDHFADIEATFNTPAVPRYNLTQEEIRTREKQERFREAKLLPKVHPYNTYRVAAKCVAPIDPIDCLKILCGEFVDYEDIRDYSPTGIIHSPEDLQEFAIGATAAARSKRTKAAITDYYQFVRLRHIVNTYVRLHFPWRDAELSKWERWMDDRALGASQDYILCLMAYERHARLEQERMDGRVASFATAGDGSSLYVDFFISWNRDFHSAAPTPKTQLRSPRNSDGGASPTKKQKKKIKKVDEACKRWN
ncbi:hypothetical protein P7C70_g9283, partial [Phenoliferia sp. Uapishka_3]